MAARPIVVPFTVFTDSNGAPLDNGYIYIGTAGLNPETNPINVYLDSALTIPIAQPIRTLSGYPSANGSPAQLYIDFVDYSITIRDRNRVFVVSTQNAVVQLTAGNITNVPSGNIAATDVQSAINELDSEKAAIAGSASQNFATHALTASGGIQSISPNALLGYGIGAGAVFNQTTSRSTSVTLNRPTGAITMFSDAGSTAWGAFTVNDSFVNANDTVVLSINGGINSYILPSPIVAAGSFTVLFASTGGTAVDAPTINFAIIKGATS